jgi:hypothetical protein
MLEREDTMENPERKDTLDLLEDLEKQVCVDRLENLGNAVSKDMQVNLARRANLGCRERQEDLERMA